MNKTTGKTRQTEIAIKKIRYKGIRKTTQQLNQLSEKKQSIFFSYIENHFQEILAEAEKENRINKMTYTIDDLNEKTQQVISNIEDKNNLTICQDEEDLYNQLGI